MSLFFIAVLIASIAMLCTPKGAIALVATFLAVVVIFFLLSLIGSQGIPAYYTTYSS